MKTLEQLVDEGAAFAKNYFEAHGKFPYCWLIQSERGTFPLVVAGDVPYNMKDQLAEGVRDILAKENADSYVFMAEAWTATVDPKEDMSRLTPPSERPDRLEILMISGENSERMIQGQFKIIRDSDNNPTLAKFELLKTDVIDGRFVGLLPNMKRNTKH